MPGMFSRTFGFTTATAKTIPYLWFFHHWVAFGVGKSSESPQKLMGQKYVFLGDLSSKIFE
jgi:hypothetical protein